MEGIIVETTLISTLNAGRVMLFKIVVVICKHSISTGIKHFHLSTPSFILSLVCLFLLIRYGFYFSFVRGINKNPLILI